MIWVFKLLNVLNCFVFYYIFEPVYKLQLKSTFLKFKHIYFVCILFYAKACNVDIKLNFNEKKKNILTANIF